MTRLRLVITLALLAAALFLEFKRLSMKPWPPRHFLESDMHFKYGSIGAEVNGYPYAIWRELPTIFADRIPNGYENFGFVMEPGHDLPIGISVRRYGVDRVGFNCATCHTAVVHVGSSTQIVLGAPAAQLDLQRYIRFLIEVSTDPRLTPDAVFASAKSNGRSISLPNRLLIQYVVFPKLREEIEQLKKEDSWMDTRPPFGPGRTDAGNSWRERWGLNPHADLSIGTVEFPAIWNQRIRLDGGFHWDGNNTSLEERNISAALAGGAAEWLMDRNSIGRVSEWMIDLPSPSYPGSIDTELARKGGVLFEHEGCASCHDSSHHNVGTVTSIDQLKTDSKRLDLFSPEMVERFNKVGSGYSWKFSHYRKTNGYVDMPLDGIWARGPYLHNGSVPSLAALLSPPSERPKAFFTGCQEFDNVALGFKCDRGFLYDTTLSGNGNQGHEFGTRLSASKKAALLEYLKSL